MGPILLERTTSPVLKKVTTKEKTLIRTSDSFGSVISSRKVCVSQNQRPQKTAGAQPKHTFRARDFIGGPEKGCQFGRKAKHQETSYNSDHGILRGQGPMEPKPLPFNSRGGGESPVRPASQHGGENSWSCVNRGHGRPTLTLPLTATPEPCREIACAQNVDTLRLYEQNEDDMDSASDLSDSERLPVPPSPCTPPQLNLRAEVYDPGDARQCLPWPRGRGHGYPDFLPPPFCTWSLRQLAQFLNTEGKGAPRPRPASSLERYLERLLQLEWLQIQTIEAESSRPAVSRFTSRSRHQSVNLQAATGPPRPSTAPPTRLSSPRTLRQCQNAFPLAFASCSHLHAQHSLAVCPSCHIRFPLCNGACSSYTYHRHSRLSPVLERRAKPGALPKRSSSESRVSAVEGQRPGSPSAGSGHPQQRMQAAGNVRGPHRTSATVTKTQVVSQSSNTRAGAGKPREPIAAEKCAPCKGMRQSTPVSVNAKVRPKTGLGNGDFKSGAAQHYSPASKGVPPARPNGKLKHTKVVAN